MFPIAFSQVERKYAVFLSTSGKSVLDSLEFAPTTEYKSVKVQSQIKRNTVNGTISTKQVMKSSTNIPNLSFRIMKKCIL